MNWEKKKRKPPKSLRRNGEEIVPYYEPRECVRKRKRERELEPMTDEHERNDK